MLCTSTSSVSQTYVCCPLLQTAFATHFKSFGSKLFSFIICSSLLITLMALRTNHLPLFSQRLLAEHDVHCLCRLGRDYGHSFVTAGNPHKQNSRFCKEIREDNFRFWWRRVHEDASQGQKLKFAFLLLEYCKIRECYAMANAFTIRKMYSLLL